MADARQRGSRSESRRSLTRFCPDCPRRFACKSLLGIYMDNENWQRQFEEAWEFREERLYPGHFRFETAGVFTCSMRNFLRRVSDKTLLTPDGSVRRFVIRFTVRELLYHLPRTFPHEDDLL